MKSYPLNKLKRILKKELKVIRKAYEQARNEKEPDNMQQWLIDNFYLINRETASVIKDMAFAHGVTADESGLPRLYSLLFCLIPDGKIPSLDIIGKKLDNYDFLISETELTALMLKAALISKACEGVEAGNDFFQNSVASLNEIYNIDFENIFSFCCEAEKVLQASDDFSASDNRTKAYFRHRLSALAKKDGKSETEFAKKLADKAREDKKSLCGILIETDKKSGKGKALLICEFILPLIIAVLTAIYTKTYYIAVLLYFPIWEIIKVFVLDLIANHTRPAIIPKIKLENGIPDNAKTIITVSSLLPAASSASKVKNHLKTLYLTNRDKNIKVCLLADLKAADCEAMPEDRIDIEAAKKMTDELNAEYRDSFMLFIRDRTFVRTENNYSGYERKRGAIEQFIKYLSGGQNCFSVCYGATENVSDTKYIMALDSDTELTFDCVTELVSAAAHPLNKPVIDEKNKIVESGYGIFIPQIETTVESAYKTAFSRIMVGTGGVSSYNTECGERYQDLFGKSIFTGKGLIDVSVYNRLLDGRLPEEKILSHDIIEGEFLRTGFLSSAQVADSFPSSEMSYLSRLSRWVRGDCQNIGFSFSKVIEYGKKTKNPFDCISKFKIFDNLRRALTPVFSFAAILLSVFMPQPLALIAIIAAVLCTASAEFFSFIYSLFTVKPKRTVAQYYGEAIPDTALRLGRIAVKIIMLPQTAITCFTAIVKSLYRLAISHKHLLEWVTAAQSDKMGKSTEMLIKALPSVLSFLWLLFLSKPFGIIIGFFFLADFPFSVFSAAQTKSKGKELDYIKREKIKSYASAMWRYYEKYCNEDNNYLPPDNVQETPVFRIAQRTSPTNIGLMLCSVLTARDLSFITTEEMYRTLEKAFDSIIKLKKWHGNLLNWYNTKTLEPLSPRYVSTVDSGNFLCCLTALKQGIKEYKSEYPLLSEIEKRIDGIIAATDLSVLYNEKRKLFHIGYDLDKNELTASYYDLLMSEARMTSYYAVAKKQVPKEHWAALSRTMSTINGYFGPVSWSGTTFEFFMPYLFVPAFRNTLTYEALKYCIYCQKLRTQKQDVPWGISESGYYGFDADMNYQYKAHGVGTLALKKCPDDELVVSPYSTFLCLPFAKQSAFENIEEFEKYEITGECGLYEALDFSKKRCTAQDYAVVRSYMAHHIGMSLTAVDNALLDGKMQKRFMADDDMLSCRSILMEKISRNASAIKEKEKKLPTEKPEKTFEQEREFGIISVTNPNVNILSNGEWTTVISDSGAGHSVYQMKNATRQSRDILREPLGVFAFVRTKNEIMPAQRASSPFGKQEFRTEFDRFSARLDAKGAMLSVKTQVTVHPRIAGEIRRYTIKNRTKKDVGATLEIYFEPSMSFFANEQAHKAFSKLFITGQKDLRSNVIIFERRSRDEENNMFCACGFTNGQRFRCNLQREQVLDRPGGIFTLNSKRDFTENNRGMVDVCAFIETDFELAAHTQKSFEFFIAAASSEDELYTKISQLRSQPELPKEKCAVTPFGIDDTALTVFPKMFFDTEKTRLSEQAVIKNEQNKNVLWANGISGDNPIIYVETNANNSIERIKKFIMINRNLRYCGIVTDLIIAFYGNGNQSKDDEKPIQEIVKEEFTPDLVNTFGGVHFIDLGDLPISFRNYLVARSNYVQNRNSDNFLLPSVSYNPVKIQNEKSGGDNLITDGKVVINNRPKLPWCYVMSNQSFGTLVSDSSLGFTFAINSHENKLTKWNNDTRYGNNGEMLFLRTGNRVYDLAASAKAVFGNETAEYFVNVEGVEIRCGVTVAQKGMKKEISVEFFNGNGEQKQMEAAYYCEPVLGSGNSENKLIKAHFFDNAIELHNPENVAYRGTLRLETEGEQAFFCTSRRKFFEGKWCVTENESFDGCAVTGKRIILPPKRKTSIKFILSYARYANAAEKIAAMETQRREIKNRIIIETDDKELDTLVNDFLLNQIMDARLNMRSGFYQCGGAYGFRDQLQDVLSLVILYPSLAKRQIARCAAAQFCEGDVLHWWHNANKCKKGVRTRYSDDLLWLPYALARYAVMTGDYDFLKTEIAFLKAEPLSDGEEERYAEYRLSEEKGTVLEHAERAIKKAMKFGEHSLLLMGGGDWNDGMNKIGILGRGESVWLSQFACVVLESMALLYENIGEADKQERCIDIAEKLKTAIDEHAYCDDHYVRAFHDDGTVVGKNSSKYCQIDSLSQSFAVFADMPDKKRKLSAIEEAYNRLVDRENGVVKLLTPAFPQSEKRVGYIAAYPQGLRENGGQYTHAAVWLAMAFFRMGLPDKGYELLEILNPIKKYNNPDLAQKYQTEPYYLCGDVYSAPGFEGRGGWSIYTGSAAWYYSAVINEMLGLKMKNGVLFIEPMLPEKIKQFKLTLIKDGEYMVFEANADGSREMSENVLPDRIVKNDRIVNLQ